MFPDASLTPMMFGISASRASVAVSTFEPVRPGDVVDHDRQRRALRDRAVVLVEAFLGGLVVVGRDREDAGGTGPGHLADGVDDLAGVVAAGPGHHRHPAGRGLDDELDDAEAFARVERRALAGGAAGNEEVHPRLHLAPGEARNRGLVEGAVARERGDERGAAPRERRSHGQILQDVAHRKPAAAPAHPARGDEGAMRERGTVADGVGQGDGLGRPVEADRVDAGHEADPRRADVDRARKAAPLERALEQQRGARRRVLLGRVVGLVDEGAVRSCGANSFAARSVSASISVAPTEKLAVTTAPTPAASIWRRTSAACACQPVVPTTRLQPRAHSAGRLAMKASGALASMATSMSRSGRDRRGRRRWCRRWCRRRWPGLRRRGLDQLTEASVADEQDVEAVGHGDLSPRGSAACGAAARPRPTAADRRP